MVLYSIKTLEPCLTHLLLGQSKVNVFLVWQFRATTEGGLKWGPSWHVKGCKNTVRQVTVASSGCPGSHVGINYKNKCKLDCH